MNFLTCLAINSQEDVGLTVIGKKRCKNTLHIVRTHEYFHATHSAVTGAVCT